MKTNTLTERIAKGSTTILIFTILTMPLGYFIRFFYSRALSISDFGLFYSALSLFAIFSIFNDLGFGYSVLHFTPKFMKTKNYRNIWYLYKYDQIIEFATSLLIALLFILGAAYLENNYFKVSGAANIVYILSISLIAESLLSALNNFYNALELEFYYSSIQLLRFIFALGISFLFWFYNKSEIVYFALAWAASYVITTLIYSYLLKNKTKYLRHKLSWDKKLFKTMQVYALPTLISASLYNLIIYTDSIALTLFRGVSEVGVYSVIFPIASISGVFLHPINKFLMPLISGLTAKDNFDLSNIVNSIFKVIPTLGVYFALFIAIFPQEITQILFGQKWAEYVLIALPVFAFGYIFSLLMSYLVNVLDGMGLVKKKLKIALTASIVNLLLVFSLTYQFGLLGTIYANIVTSIISVVLFSIVIKERVKFNIPYYYYLKIIWFSSILFFLIKKVSFKTPSTLNLIIYGIVYSTVFICVSLYLGMLDKPVLKILTSMFSKRNE